MTLIFTPPSLTRFYNSGGYAKNELVDLSSTPFQDVPVGLLNWLQTQISEGESVAQIVLEVVGRVGVTFEKQIQFVSDSDGAFSSIEVQVPVTFRDLLSAAVSVSAPQGSRTFTLSSESLPSELRDGLISAWEYINGLE